MDPRAIEAVIAKRFGLPRAPTLVARVAASKLPVVFTYLRSTEARRRQSMDVPREQSFSFQVPLTPFPWDAWFAGKQRSVSPAIPGNAYLFDLSNNPTVGLNTAFSTVRLNISQSALDALAYERGLRRAGGLRAPSLGYPDPVMHGLAQTLVAAMEQPGMERACSLTTSRWRFTPMSFAPTAVFLLAPCRDAAVSPPGSFVVLASLSRQIWMAIPRSRMSQPNAVCRAATSPRRSNRRPAHRLMPGFRCGASRTQSGS